MKDIKELIRGEIKSSLPSQALVPVETGESSRSEPMPGPSTEADEEDPVSETEDFGNRFVTTQFRDPERQQAMELEVQSLLDKQTVPSLSWWTQRENLEKGVPWVRSDEVILTTDASPQGWGAYTTDIILQGLWKPEEAALSQNVRELRAVFMSLSQALPLLRDRHVKIQSDNSSVVAYINHQGGTRSRELMRVAHFIFRLVEPHLSSLTALHLKGSENIRPDYLSRHQLNQGEWSLSVQVFQQICARWGHPVIDLFASKANKKDDPQSSQEGQAGQSSGYHDSAILAQEGVVLLVDGHVHYRSLATARDSGSSQSGSDLPSGSQESPPDCMAIERQILIDRGLSPST
ncbi:uncharacterized protein [Dendropsophus ebraccatus]|uniref:uncharacterized protein n=1 Tax=Dendropsophus ebraccatus TaxID=150705 RepID=UPI00383166BE